MPKRHTSQEPYLCLRLEVHTPLFIPLGLRGFQPTLGVYTPFEKRGMNISRPFGFICPRGKSVQAPGLWEPSAHAAFQARLLYDQRLAAAPVPQAEAAKRGAGLGMQVSRILVFFLGSSFVWFFSFFCGAELA